jgi:hypothetical protein
MEQGTPLLSKEQWIERLQGWAIERWGRDRAETIRPEIEATAEHLLTLAAYPLAMEQVPGFFMYEA